MKTAFEAKQRGPDRLRQDFFEINMRKLSERERAIAAAGDANRGRTMTRLTLVEHLVIVLPKALNLITFKLHLLPNPTSVDIALKSLNGHTAAGTESRKIYAAYCNFPFRKPDNGNKKGKGKGNGHQGKNNNGNQKNQGQKRKNGDQNDNQGGKKSKGNKYCSRHGSGSHSTEECRLIAKEAQERKDNKPAKTDTAEQWL